MLPAGRESGGEAIIARRSRALPCTQKKQEGRRDAEGENEIKRRSERGSEGLYLRGEQQLGSYGRTNRQNVCI